MQFENGNNLYTGGVRYLSADEETSCVKCGLDNHKARALRLPIPTIPKPGYILCLSCGPDAYKADDWNPTHREEARRIDDEIRACFLEDTQRGERGGGGSSGRRREKKPGEKFTVRFEQEWQGFLPANGIGGGELVVTNTQYRVASERLNLSLPAELKTELDQVAKAENSDLSSILRTALDTYLAADSEPVLPGEVTRVSVQVRIYEDQRALIDLAAQQWRVTKSDIAASCCTRLLSQK